MDKTLQMLRELVETPGIPGQEQDVRRVMQRYLEPLATCETDYLGSLIARKEGSSAFPRIMVAAHLDEIGFMVRYITEDGFLKFQPLGGWWEQVLLSQRVLVRTRRGDLVGIVGSKPPHLLTEKERSQLVEQVDMFIDVGAADKAEAMSWGIRPGDGVVPIGPFTVMRNEKLMMAKGWDNRIGCGVVVELLRALQEEQHPNTVFGVANVQEEVGLRGANTSTFVVQPDIGIALESAIAGDTPGVKPEEAKARLGEGPTILLYDQSMVPHTPLRDFVLDTAEEEGIPYQVDLMPGGLTDAGRIHLYGRGVPSVVIGVPARYIHTHGGIVHRDDFDNTVRLLRALVRRLDQDTVEALRS